MQSFSTRFLLLFLFFSFGSISLYGEKKSSPAQEDIRINFENISMVEFLKFVSKVADVNVIYDPTAMNFNVTIVSQEATTVENILSALIQILRIHGYTLLEEDQNLIIHNNPSVRQIPTVVSEEKPLNADRPPAIMTRVFKIRKANPSTLAALLTPLLSTQAIIEVSTSTSQLIITDTASSIKTIEDLLLSLDMPDSPQDVAIYMPKNMSSTDLLAIGKQIIMPLAGTDSINLFEQKATGAIYIVSTPLLLQKATSILGEIDKEAKKSAAANSFFVYTIKQASEEQIHNSLTTLADRLEAAGSPDKDLISAIDSMRWIKSTHSLLFTGSPKALQEIHELLTTFDIPASKSQSALTQAPPGTEFMLYDPKALSPKDLKAAIDEMVKTLRSSDLSDPGFLHTLETARILPASKQLTFTGDKASLDRLRQILPDLDRERSIVFVSLSHISAAKMLSILHETAKKLENSPNTSSSFIRTLQTAQSSPDSRSILLSGTASDVANAKEIIVSHDVPLPASQNEVLLYKPKHLKAEELKTALDNIAQNTEKGAPQGEMQELVQTIHSLYILPDMLNMQFVGTPKALQRLQEILASIDIAEHAKTPKMISPTASTQFILYSPKTLSPKELKASIEETAKNLRANQLADPGLLNTLETARILPSSNQLMFTGDKASLQRLQEILPDLDQERAITLVPLNNSSATQIIAILQDTARKLEKSSGTVTPFIKTLQTAQSSPDNRSILLSGTASDVAKAKEIILSHDLLKPVTAGVEVFLYAPKSLSPMELKNSIEEMSKYLRTNQPADPAFLNTLETARVLPSSNQLMFTGDKPSLQRLQEILPDLDQEHSLIFIPLNNSSAPRILAILHETAQKLAKSPNASASFIKTLQTAQSSPDNRSIVLSGNPSDVAKAKEIVLSHDLPTMQGTEVFIYKPKYMKPQKLKNALNAIAQNAEKGFPQEDTQDLIQVIRSMQTLPDTPTVQFVGTPKAIQKLQVILTAVDIPEQESSLTAGQEREVFIYRPKNITPEQVKSALTSIAKNAEKSSPKEDTEELIQTIYSMNILPDMSTIQFVGTAKVIQKLQEILATIDNPEQAKNPQPIAPGSNFLTYKVQHLNPTELLSELKQLIQDSVTLTNNQNLLRSVRGGRYIKDSNSLVFTGTPEDLDKIQKLLVSLDVSVGPNVPATPRVAPTYKLYKPQVVAGAELIRMARTFQERLAATGVVDQNLKETIDHLTYVNQTNTIIVSGTTEEIEKVYNLLQEFDTSSSLPTKKLSDQEIETINDTGFLLVKLQNQSGSGIVDALNRISTDLSLQKNQTKTNSLLQAIQSVQWIEMTNSLIASGDPEVLKRLRELIEMIDRPLKQVFIEILVLETSTANQFDLGLRWGSQGKVNNKLGWGLGNYPVTDGSQGFPGNFNNITGTTVPIGSDIPPLPGGFLGAIGDIIWHKGQSYASLGSLLNAFKADADTTIVLSQKIIAQDNQNAKIFSGDNVPFTGSLVTTSGLSQTTNANLEYRNIGITVSITPIIGDSGLITLDIDEEISEEVNTGSDSSTTSTNSLNGIRTSKTSAQTRVTMLDQYFLILCGTIRNQNTRVVAGVPCLGGLPLIGAAFNQNQKLTNSHNVVIFIRPHIIPSQEAYSEFTKTQEDLFGSKELSNVEDYHKMLEILRAPDNEVESAPETTPRSHISRLLP